MTDRSPAGTPLLASARDVAIAASRALATPVRLEVLKDKPGRRRTWRATGPRGAAIVKTYTSDRAATVATRLAALSDDTSPVTTPRVLDVDPERRIVVLTEVPGRPWHDAIIADADTCHTVGAALAAWHRHWYRRPPASLTAHTADAELTAIHRQAARSTDAASAAVVTQAAELAAPWPSTTVVHRDLYEDQIVLDDHRVGLIDLDDAATGPPELDVGNVLGHLDLLGLRHGEHLARRAEGAFLHGYRVVADLDEGLLARCRRLTRLRLACIHPDACVFAAS